MKLGRMADILERFLSAIIVKILKPESLMILKGILHLSVGTIGFSIVHSNDHLYRIDDRCEVAATGNLMLESASIRIPVSGHCNPV